MWNGYLTRLRSFAWTWTPVSTPPPTAPIATSLRAGLGGVLRTSVPPGVRLGCPPCCGCSRGTVGVPSAGSSAGVLQVGVRIDDDADRPLPALERHADPWEFGMSTSARVPAVVGLLVGTGVAGVAARYRSSIQAAMTVSAQRR